MKVYWPYLPVLSVVLLGVAASIYIISTRNDLSAPPSVSAQTLLSQTNDQRLQDDLNALKQNTQLTAAAQAKANNMVSQNYWSHNSPNGTSPWSFITNSGYDFQLAGENLAYGFSNSSSVINAWMNSQSHRANVLNPSYNDVGFGIAASNNFMNKGPETIVVAIYAAPQGSTLSTATSLNSAHPFTSVSTVQPSSKTIGRIETFTVGSPNWAIFITGLVGGAAICLLIIRHGLFVKKWARQSEKMLIKHPVIDLVLVGAVIISALLYQTAGVVL